MIFLRFSEEFGTGIPVHFKGLQIGWADLGTFTATNAGHLGGGRRKQGGGTGQDAVGGLDNGNFFAGHGHAHHGPAHDETVGIGLGLAQGQQITHGRTDGGFKVARGGNISGNGDDAGNQGTAKDDGIANGVGRTGVETLHAVVGRTLAMRHFDAGEHPDELLRATGRVAGRNDDDLNLCIPPLPDGGLHGGNGLGLVVFDADQSPPGLEYFPHDGYSLDDASGAFAHLEIVAGDVRLALRAIDDQGVEFAVLARIQLGVAWENRAAQADNARIAQVIARDGRRGIAVVEGYAPDPAFFEIRLDDNAQGRQAGRVRHAAHLDGFDRPRGRGMNSRRSRAIRRTDTLAFQYFLTRCHQRTRCSSHALVERNDELPGERRGSDGQTGGFFLVVSGLDAAVEAEQFSGHQATFLISMTGYFHFQVSTVSPVGIMAMQSTGHGGMHSSQPVH